MEFVVDTEDGPTDRPFNPFRYAKSAKAKQVVADVLNQVQNYEKYYGLRKRARKPQDQKTFERQVEALVSDSIHRALTEPNGWLAVTFSKTVLGRANRYRSPVMSKTLPEVIRGLSAPEMDFLKLELGYENRFVSHMSKQSVIRAGGRLLTRIEDHGLQLSDLGLERSQEVIILKSSKEGFFEKGTPVQYADTELTRRYRDEIVRINGWLDEADIEYDSPLSSEWVVDANNRRLRRVFNNGSFEEGGRLFGGFWQNLGKKQRHEGIFIEGSPVVTLDYGQMCPRILYGLVGVEPHFEDAYKVPGIEYWRNGVKKVFNAMLHASKPLERLPMDTRKLLPGIYRASEIFDLITTYHDPVKHLFFSGKGLAVLHKESEILVSLLLKLMDQGIVALPVHDAVIVSEHHQDATRETMLEVFKSHTGIEGIVEVDD